MYTYADGTDPRAIIKARSVTDPSPNGSNASRGDAHTRKTGRQPPTSAQPPALARMAEGRGGACQNCHIWGPLRDLLLVTGFLLGLLAGFAFFVYYYEEHFSVKLMGSRLEKS